MNALVGPIPLYISLPIVGCILEERDGQGSMVVDPRSLRGLRSCMLPALLNISPRLEELLTSLVLASYALDN